jgi:hypothetical protein
MKYLRHGKQRHQDLKAIKFVLFTPSEAQKSVNDNVPGSISLTGVQFTADVEAPFILCSWSIFYQQ